MHTEQHVENQMNSPKSQTNKKWTSNDEFKSNYDRIFGKKERPSCPICGDGMEPTADERNGSPAWYCNQCRYVMERNEGVKPNENL